MPLDQTQQANKDRIRKKFGYLNAIAGDNRLTRSDLAIANKIVSYFMNKEGAAYPSQALLAEEVDVCVRTVRNSLNRLEEFGLITIIRRKGRKNTNYIFPRLDYAQEEHKENRQGRSDFDDGALENRKNDVGKPVNSEPKNRQSVADEPFVEPFTNPTKLKGSSPKKEKPASPTANSNIPAMLEFVARHNDEHLRRCVDQAVVDYQRMFRVNHDPVPQIRSSARSKVEMFLKRLFVAKSNGTEEWFNHDGWKLSEAELKDIHERIVSRM